MAKKARRTWEYGDFQTPLALAAEAVSTLRESLSFVPATIIEPTCGMGSFLLAAADAFPKAEQLIALDIDNSHLAALSERIGATPHIGKLRIIHGDFFKTDWAALLAEVPKPILVIGNPPWVTNADIGTLQGSNLPAKSNFQNRSGLDAVTGKANFDISEWMLIQHMNWLREYSGCIAMLCKTAVARKVLLYAWKHGIPTVDNRLVQIDAMRHFNAAVDACFFSVETNHNQTSTDCKYYETFAAKAPSQLFGYHDGMMLSDVSSFHPLRHIIGEDKNFVWRSGLKHDCSKVMELREHAGTVRNGFDEFVSIEDDYVFPLLKSSDLGNGRVDSSRLRVIVTQTKIGESTNSIRDAAPRTWRYLVNHSDLLDNRRSVIYRGKPRFSIFGIGPYAFADWKVAISGFYKRLDFRALGPSGGKPIMLDDTSYFLSCSSAAEAEFLASLLNSPDAKALLSSMIFWSDKRPVTLELLRRLHIGRLAKHLGQERQYRQFVSQHSDAPLFSAAPHERASERLASAP